MSTLGERLEGLKPLLEKATPRPWKRAFSEYGGYDCMTAAWNITRDNALEFPLVCTLDCSAEGHQSSEQSDNDSALIVAAVNAVSELAAAPSLHKEGLPASVSAFARRDFKGRFLVSGMFDYEDGSKRIAMKLWDVSLESLEPAALHKEAKGPHKFLEYPHDDPTVLAIEHGYRKWEEESSCHEIGCGCVTVWIWRELAALHKEGAGGALDAAAIRNATIEEIASFAETHYCIIDANSLGGYKTCERPKHPNEPFARAIRALMDCSGGRAATDAPKETPRGA